jgi:glutaredoxin
MEEWVVYTRESCSLCEQFIQDLADLLGERAGEVQLVDVGSSPQLEQRFGQKVPVLTIDGDIVCMYRVDTERVRAHLM